VVQSPAEAASLSPDWLIRPFERSSVAPIPLAVGVGIAWLLLVALVHAMAHVLVGPARLPFDATRFVWTMVVDATLIAALLAGHAHLYLKAASDLRELRPLLSESGQDVARLTREVRDLSTSIRAAVTLVGIACGLAVVVLDPKLRGLYADLPASDPRYLVFVAQNVIFGVLGARLFAAEVHMTRAYARLGKRIEVDLFDPTRLLVFARKGLRSVVVWVVISSVYSMFWVLDSAGQANVALPIVLLVLVTVALVAPTYGVHERIAAAKADELARVSEAIRSERDRALAPRRADAPPEDARLGNLIQYQEFVRSIRDWPFDLSIVSRSALLMVLGAGSWLGGAVVERLLGLALD
jgi:hypothetical protein